MAKNLVLGPTLAHLAQIWAPKFFSWILPLLEVWNYCKISLYAIPRKTNEPNLRKWQKNIVSCPILAQLAQIRVTIFFFKNLASSVTRYQGQLLPCLISEKTKYPDRRSDGQTERRTDRQTRLISKGALRQTSSVPKAT